MDTDSKMIFIRDLENRAHFAMARFREQPVEYEIVSSE